jgi:alkaline phosphatase
MSHPHVLGTWRWGFGLALVALAPAPLGAAPTVTRLTPPSGLFSYGDPSPPIIARFLPGQRFDLQATIRPDAGRTITQVEFFVDGASVGGTVALTPATAGGHPAGTVVASRRAYSASTAGERRLRVRATQSDGTTTTAEGNFEIVPIFLNSGDPKPRNLIILIGDGLGIAHRTAARIMLHGVSQGKALAPLAMDEMPVTGIVRTSSLNSIVTDSSPGAAVYSTGNKNDNNEEGVFPDDTADAFDNPRIENIGEYLARTQGKWLGIVTTTDVTDATPAAFGVHTSNRGAGTGIADQFLDEAVPKANLRVLLGGGRSWFLPSGVAGSSRSSSSDYQLPDELAAGWGVKAGAKDSARDLLQDFQTAGFSYVGDRQKLAALPPGTTRLLGLFQLGHLNAALDRIDRRRGRSTVVNEYGFPEQPMLDEMVVAALNVLQAAPAGFVLMIEGGNIDKQAHAMDTERWLVETIEFDRAVKRATAFADKAGGTLVLVTADHETGGANIIGASVVSNATLSTASRSGGGAATLRDGVVGTYGSAGFPQYTINDDGYPETTDVDRRLLVGYAANADRYEDWMTNAKPLGAPGGPGSPRDRDTAGGFLITGQVPGSQAVHTASDVPLSAAGDGAALFSGTMDNTDVFFRAMQAMLGGAPMLSASGGRLSNPYTSVTVVGASAANFSAPSGQRTASNRLINLSTRGQVGTGADVMISGFVLNGTASHRLLIRGVGPELSRYQLQGVLADPVLRLFNSAGTEVARVNDWSEGGEAVIAAANAAVGAFTLTSGSKDAAMLVTLPPGRYTVELSGHQGATGRALLEVYELP